MDQAAEVVDGHEDPHGEIVLRRRGECFEIIANGCFLMDSSDGRSERLMVSAALGALARPEGASILIGGLGVGFSLAQACADPRPGRIRVVEREQAVIDWHTQGSAPLRRFAGQGHDDRRVRILPEDLLRHLRATAERYDAVCLDIDNGPDWTVPDDNRGFLPDRQEHHEADEDDPLCCRWTLPGQCRGGATPRSPWATSSCT